MQMSQPLAVIAGHNRAVSYVRFMGASQLATASTDNTLKLWDIHAASSGPALTKPLSTFTGSHTSYISALTACGAKPALLIEFKLQSLCNCYVKGTFT